MINSLWNALLFPFRKWLSIYDRYIIRKYLSTTLFTFCIIIAIAVIIDYSEKTENFVKYKPTAEQIIFDYYFNFIPHIAALLAPLLIFLAVIFFTSRMAYNSEIIALRNSGITMSRYLRPFIICGVFSALLLLFANHWLVPVANKTRIAFEDKYTRVPKSYGNNIHLRLDNNTLVSLERFKYSTGEGTNFALERFEGSGKNKRMVYKINADRVKFMPGVKNWRLTNYKYWKISENSETFVQGRQMDTTLRMSPESFDIDVIIKETLNYKEINAFMESEKLKGASGIEYFQVEQNRRTAAAASVIIMIVMGAAIGSWKVRGGMGLNIVVALALASLYVVFLQFSASFSVNGSLPPVIGANIPNLIYLLITFYLIRISNK